MRSGVAVFTWLRMRASSCAVYGARGPSRPSGLASPAVPFSKDRSAFCSAWEKVRPIDITSPTDFMLVVRVRSACGNFSKLKRGILTTQ